MSTPALSDLANAINNEHAAAIGAAHSAVQRARQAGELLLEAKARCFHGAWLPWLRDNCPDIAERTAQAYMRLARGHLADPEHAARLEAQTVREALAELAAPKSATAADLPPALRSGGTLIGTHGEMARLAIVESRAHRGYWHILDLLDGTVTTRPMRGEYIPRVLEISYPAAAELAWQCAPDDRGPWPWEAAP